MHEALAPYREIHLLDYAALRIIDEGKYTGASVMGTLNRREALEGADYIIISVLVGGYARRVG